MSLGNQGCWPADTAIFSRVSVGFVRQPGRWLLDHLIRLEEKARRDSEAEGLGGLQVDDQLELHGVLHGQVTLVSRGANYSLFHMTLHSQTLGFTNIERLQ